MNQQGITYVRGCTTIEQLASLPTPSLDYTINKMSFFYNPPNDYQIYHVTIELFHERPVLTTYDYMFYFILKDNRTFRISILLIPPFLNVQYLNRKMFGIELKQDGKQYQSYLIFSKYQKDNLEYHLKEFINFEAQKQVNKIFDGNKQQQINKVSDRKPKL